MISQQAIVTLMYWASNAEMQAQENLSVFLEKEFARFHENNMPITGRSVEALIEEWENTPPNLDKLKAILSKE